MVPLERKIIVGFSIAILVLLIVSILSGLSARAFRHNAQRVTHTYRVIGLLEQLFSGINEAESCRRGFVIHHEQALERQFRQVTQSLPVLLGQLQKVTQDNPVQQNHLLQLQPLISEKMNGLLRSFELWKKQGEDSLLEQTAITREGVLLTDQIRGVISSMQREEQRLLELRNSRLDRSQWTTQLVIISSSGLTITIVGVAAWLILRDITARRRAETMLASSNAELKAFAYTVSHDLKAPLRGIVGYAQELERKHATSLTERAHFCIRQIITATRNLDLLIEDLLEYSKIGGERQSVSEVPIKMLLDRLLRTYQEVLEKRKVEILIDLPFSSVTAWERGLQQALSNILDNAIKYTEMNPQPKIEITGEEDRAGWTIQVKDNGIGFNMEYHDKIFGLFNRLVRSDQFEGTGAGLAIARKLLEKQGGVVYAQSTPGVGSTFYIKIPKQV